MASTLKIGILGDFDAENPTHIATNDGIRHASACVNHFPVEAIWLPTDEPHEFGAYQGLFCSPGSPYRSLDGALAGIRYAREHKVPFLGTCGGFQHLVLEYARNVMDVSDAAHAESDPYASRLFVTPLSCSLVGKSMEVRIKPGTQAAAMYDSHRATEHYYCNFGLNPAYEDDLANAGLCISGDDEAGEARIIELPSHPFFLGTLFVPQANSTNERPHPAILAFVRAATRNHAEAMQLQR